MKKFSPFTYTFVCYIHETDTSKSALTRLLEETQAKITLDEGNRKTIDFQSDNKDEDEFLEQLSKEYEGVLFFKYRRKPKSESEQQAHP